MTHTCLFIVYFYGCSVQTCHMRTWNSANFGVQTSKTHVLWPMFCRLSWYAFRRPNIRILYQHMLLFWLRLTKLWCFISLNLPVCLCNCVQIYILNYNVPTIKTGKNCYQAHVLYKQTYVYRSSTVWKFPFFKTITNRSLSNIHVFIDKICHIYFDHI